MPTETEKETVFEHDGIMYGERPTELCFSVRHGYKLICRNEDWVREYDTARRVVGKRLERPGYVMELINHRCEVPLEELHNALLIRDGNPKSPIRERKGPCGQYEWRTASELAKIVDRTDDTFVPEMYRLSVACGKIRAGTGDRRFDMSEGLFIKTLKSELKAGLRDPKLTRFPRPPIPAA